MGSMALQLKPFSAGDPFENFSRAMSLRDMMDQRRYRALQQQALEQRVADQQEEMAQARNLRELFASNPNPTNQQVMSVAPGSLGFRWITEMRQADTAAEQAKNAALTRQKTQNELDTFKRQLARYKAEAILKLPDPAQRAEAWARHTPELVDLGLVDPEELKRGYNDNTFQQMYIRSEGDEAWQKNVVQPRLQAERLQADEERKQAEEVRKQAEEVRKQAEEVRKQAKEERDIAAAGRPTGTLREFEDAFLPGWLQQKGKTAATPADRTNAYREFRELLRERIGVPGVDFPLPSAVAQQRVEMGKATAEAKPPTEGERKALGFYTRLKDAEDVMGSLETWLSNLSPAGQIRLKAAPDWAQTEHGQVYKQAIRQFTEARLRKESGAAIAPSEYAVSERTYFPQPLDTPETLKRKAAARKVIMDAVKRESGRAYKEAFPEGETPPPAGVPKVGDTLPNGEKVKKVTKVQ